MQVGLEQNDDKLQACFTKHLDDLEIIWKIPKNISFFFVWVHSNYVTCNIKIPNIVISLKQAF